MEIAILGLGCFWGPEIKFSKLNGIIKTEVGYCGGHSAKTNYKEVCSGTTNHAEVVKLEFDPKVISYEKILEFFFEFHDPTTLNSQGPDFGTQYRSEIFYLNDNQKNIAKKIIEENNSKLAGRVVTKLSPLKNYCKAEEYHQKYLDK
tara:strand:- start:187 stop:627 length:441 start_codon:yes stop_codon:yes gene_type:complete